MGVRALVVVSGVLLLSGCSGTRFGEQLSRSFSAPAGQPDQGGTSATSALGPSSALGTTAKALAPKTPITKPPNALAPTEKKPPTPKPLPAPVAMAPAPYRVTLKLPSADPSAPAEVVTRALRAAGVQFEVETIERVRNGSSGQAGGAGITPAPAVR